MCLKVIIVVVCVISVSGSGIYHENTKITFRGFSPDAELFGYSVVMNRYGLIVGAPKATTKSGQTGLVFNCSLDSMNDVYPATVNCSPAVEPNELSGLLKDDMWFGATVVSLTDGKSLFCAPRFTEPYSSKHLLAHGVCLISTNRGSRHSAVYPLSDKGRQAFMTDGKRREYGEYGTHLNFYAYGQAGMSMKVVENGNLIIGAPGLLQWTGGIVNYRFSPRDGSNYFSKQVITNPYYTHELGPDDYFGYSVDAGVFLRSEKTQTLFVGGAPRSARGYGQVLVFESALREQHPLKIHAKLVGPQLGGYFGASLCCLDIDGDGLSDLLVGAPTYVVKDGGLPYDQGAVFVYMTKQTDNGFNLTEAGHVMGSGASGARFGTTIADLGDVDGDGFRDVAIAAPWENNDSGVVYIYRGSAKGLKSQYSQKIEAEGAKSFGISIPKGIDVDHNHCNDLAIGAAVSGTAYVYRCVPSMTVQASIKVPDAMNLPHNATGFTALFCVMAAARPQWPHVKAEFNTKIVIDPEENRAELSENTQYNVSLGPGEVRCNEQTVDVKPTADLSKPISMKFFLDPVEVLKNDSMEFNYHIARVSEDSVLESSFLIQLVRDCGEDMICTPWLDMTLETFDNPYTPGLSEKLGAKLTIVNTEEPAYGAKVNITLPLIPKRLPSPCTLEDLVMTCDVPAPLFRDEEVSWEIELEYKETNETFLKITVELDDPLYNRNISKESVVKVLMEIQPISVFNIVGKPLPNDTIPVKRDKLYEADDITFIHYFEISNIGPSSWINTEVTIVLPETVNLSSAIRGCVPDDNGTVLECNWYIPAKASHSIVLPLRFELANYGNLLKLNSTLNITTEVILNNIRDGNGTASVTTTLVLDPAPIIWHIIALGVVSGLILLAAIVYLLYKSGFFSRQQREMLKDLQDGQTQPLTESDAASSSASEQHSIEADESTLELLSDSD